MNKKTLDFTKQEHPLYKAYQDAVLDIVEKLGGETFDMISAKDYVIEDISKKYIEKCLSKEVIDEYEEYLNSNGLSYDNLKFKELLIEKLSTSESQKIMSLIITTYANDNPYIGWTYKCNRYCYNDNHSKCVFDGVKIIIPLNSNWSKSQIRTYFSDKENMFKLKQILTIIILYAQKNISKYSSFFKIKFYCNCKG